MQFKLITVAALASLAAATPLRRDQCNTGPVQCCQSVQSADSHAAAGLLSLLGVVVEDVSALVGITCSPISVIGIAGNSCTAQPVCCQNNNFNGVIALGCTPINVNV